MALRVLCWLLTAFIARPVFAAGPLEVAGQWLSGDVIARISTSSGASQDSMRTSMRFGPGIDCYAPMGVDRFSLTLFGPERILDGGGSWHTTEDGRPVLALDPLSFEDELGDAYRSACETTSPPEACAEALAALEPRRVRSEIELRPRERNGTRRARLRGRIELELFDPIRETVAFSWSLTFRDGSALAVYRPASFGFCGIYFPIGG